MRSSTCRFRPSPCRSQWHRRVGEVSGRTASRRRGQCHLHTQTPPCSPAPQRQQPCSGGTGDRCACRQRGERVREHDAVAERRRRLAFGLRHRRAVDECECRALVELLERQGRRTLRRAPEREQCAGTGKSATGAERERGVRTRGETGNIEHLLIVGWMSPDSAEGVPGRQGHSVPKPASDASSRSRGFDRICPFATWSVVEGLSRSPRGAHWPRRLEGDTVASDSS